MRFPALILVVGLMALFTGCDQQQPLASKPPPPPGTKAGETPAVEPEKTGPQRHADGAVPVPPPTAPTTPGVQNHPAAPEIPLPPPPTSSPTAAPPISAPPAGDDAANPTTSGTPSGDGALRQPSDRGRTDQGITVAIYRVLSGQPGLSLDGHLIVVDTRNGEVVLRGSARNDSERDQIIALVGRVAGVRAVDSRLEVDER